MKRLFRRQLAVEHIQMQMMTLSERLNALEEAEAHLVFAEKLMREARIANEIYKLRDIRMGIYAKLEAGFDEMEILEERARNIQNRKSSSDF